MSKMFMLLFLSIICNFAVAMQPFAQVQKKPSELKLPYQYFAKNPNDRFSVIYQGAYKIFDVANDSDDVIVIGPLRPCMGLVVTDGKKIIAFHKAYFNSIESMKEIVKKNLDTENSKNLYARIFSTKDELEWHENARSSDHGNKDHYQAMKHVRDSFITDPSLNFNSEKFVAEMFNLRDENGLLKSEINPLGDYEAAEKYIAIRVKNLFQKVNGQIKIKFMSLDPYVEDVYNLHAKDIYENEFPDIHLRTRTVTSEQFFNKVQELYGERKINYNNIPMFCQRAYGWKNTKILKLNISIFRREKEEDAVCQRIFGYPKSMIQTLASVAYDSVAFIENDPS